MSSPQARQKLTWYSCNNGNCIEVSNCGEDILIRDSKDAEGATLLFTRAEWENFRDAIKAGAFDAV